MHLFEACCVRTKGEPGGLIRILFSFPASPVEMDLPVAHYFNQLLQAHRGGS